MLVFATGLGVVGILDIVCAVVFVELAGSVRPIEIMPFAGTETKPNQNRK